ncbi:unnamed protein product [Paramecium octaurelia]|uniref:Uncharacterized protein n=1 Tax=Paramecium octaurelia TaxID=43137 RepID=A0A8S1W639_PAROT|nr:unnamed protein product [Paramecium octaurelia]
MYNNLPKRNTQEIQGRKVLSINYELSGSYNAPNIRQYWQQYNHGCFRKLPPTQYQESNELKCDKLKFNVPIQLVTLVRMTIEANNAAAFGQLKTFNIKIQNFSCLASIIFWRSTTILKQQECHPIDESLLNFQQKGNQLRASRLMASHNCFLQLTILYQLHDTQEQHGTRYRN